MENHCELIRCIDMVHESISGCLGAANLALQQGLERPLHITRGKRPSIVELDPLMEMKDVSLGIRNFPAFGDSWSDAQALIPSKQILKE